MEEIEGQKDRVNKMVTVSQYLPATGVVGGSSRDIGTLLPRGASLVKTGLIGEKKKKILSVLQISQSGMGIT
jgi:hypothetical protein